jgi:hypothetical protein
MVVSSHTAGIETRRLIQAVPGRYLLGLEVHQTVQASDQGRISVRRNPFDEEGAATSIQE